MDVSRQQGGAGPDVMLRGGRHDGASDRAQESGGSGSDEVIHHGVSVQHEPLPGPVVPPDGQGPEGEFRRDAGTDLSLQQPNLHDGREQRKGEGEAGKDAHRGDVGVHVALTEVIGYAQNPRSGGIGTAPVQPPLGELGVIKAPEQGPNAAIGQEADCRHEGLDRFQGVSAEFDQEEESALGQVPDEDVGDAAVHAEEVGILGPGSVAGVPGNGHDRQQHEAKSEEDVRGPVGVGLVAQEARTEDGQESQHVQEIGQGVAGSTQQSAEPGGFREHFVITDVIVGLPGRRPGEGIGRVVGRGAGVSEGRVRRHEAGENGKGRPKDVANGLRGKAQGHLQEDANVGHAVSVIPIDVHPREHVQQQNVGFEHVQTKDGGQGDAELFFEGRGRVPLVQDGKQRLTDGRQIR